MSLPPLLLLRRLARAVAAARHHQLAVREQLQLLHKLSERDAVPSLFCEKAEGARDRAPESVPLKSLRRGRLRKTESVNTIDMWGKLASRTDEREKTITAQRSLVLESS